jgi:sensor histidine kinase YesM
LMFITHQLPTLGATARSNVTMTWFFKLSRIVSLMTLLIMLPHIIWGLRTQVSSATGLSPFFLVYDSEAILPTDVTFGAPCIQFYEEGEAEKTRHVDLDNLEEQRVTAVMRQAHHDQQLRRYMIITSRSAPSTLAT